MVANFFPFPSGLVCFVAQNDLPPPSNVYQAAKIGVKQSVDIAANGLPHISHNDAKLISEEAVNLSAKDSSRVSRTLSSATVQSREPSKASVPPHGSVGLDSTVSGNGSDMHLKKKGQDSVQEKASTTPKLTGEKNASPQQAQQVPRAFLKQTEPSKKEGASSSKESENTKKTIRVNKSFSMDVVSEFFFVKAIVNSWLTD